MHRQFPQFNIEEPGGPGGIAGAGTRQCISCPDSTSSRDAHSKRQVRPILVPTCQLVRQESACTATRCYGSTLKPVLGAEQEEALRRYSAPYCSGRISRPASASEYSIATSAYLQVPTMHWTPRPTPPKYRLSSPLHWSSRVPSGAARLMADGGRGGPVASAVCEARRGGQSSMYRNADLAAEARSDSNGAVVREPQSTGLRVDGLMASLRRRRVWIREQDRAEDPVWHPMILSLGITDLPTLPRKRQCESTN